MSDAPKSPEHQAWIDWTLTTLPTLDYDQTNAFYRAFLAATPPRDDIAWLGIVDRYFLLVAILKLTHMTEAGGRSRRAAEWLFKRCREVEANPDGRLDLWAREHFKTTIITFGGVMQEILRNPELTVGVFSHTRGIAKMILTQIKREFESNEALKDIYSDVCWTNPARDAPKWSENEGIVLRRKGNPREATVEAWGLVDGQPTGKHFSLMVYDDVVTLESVTSPEMVKKTLDAFEVSTNLGAGDARRWMIGTRYHFADPYGPLMDRKVAKPRIYPATDNGRLDGEPVFLSPAAWAQKKRDQGTKAPAQMLQNPAAGNETIFAPEWLRGFEVRPRLLNIYIMADPSKGRTRRSDRTAIAVIGVDSLGNRYFLDGWRHRMTLEQRWNALRQTYRKWLRAPGVATVSVGYEAYGIQTDIEYFELEMQRLAEQNQDPTEHFAIDELAWPREGGHSKMDRIERLQPDLKDGKFFVPLRVNDAGILSKWRVENGLIHYDAIDGKETKRYRDAIAAGNRALVIEPIGRLDEDRAAYDLTKEFIDEMMAAPFGTHDDLLDAASRLYDMDPTPPRVVNARDLEPTIHVDGV